MNPMQKSISMKPPKQLPQALNSSPVRLSSREIPDSGCLQFDMKLILPIIVIFIFINIYHSTSGSKLKSKTKLRVCKQKKEICAFSDRRKRCQCKSGMKCVKNQSKKFICKKKTSKKQRKTSKRSKCKISEKPDMVSLTKKVTKALKSDFWRGYMKISVWSGCKCVKGSKGRNCKRVSKHCTRYIADNFMCSLAKNARAAKCSLQTNIERLDEFGVFRRINKCQARKKNCRGHACVTYGLFKNCLKRNPKGTDCIIHKITKKDIANVGQMGDIISPLVYYVNKMRQRKGKYAEYASSVCDETDFEFTHKLRFVIRNDLNVPLSIQASGGIHINYGPLATAQTIGDLKKKTTRLLKHPIFSIVSALTIPNLIEGPRDQGVFDLNEASKCYHQGWWEEQYKYRNLMLTANVSSIPNAVFPLEYRTWMWLHSKSLLRPSEYLDPDDTRYERQDNIMCTIQSAKKAYSVCKVAVNSYILSGCYAGAPDTYIVIRLYLDAPMLTTDRWPYVGGASWVKISNEGSPYNRKHPSKANIAIKHAYETCYNSGNSFKKGYKLESGVATVNRDGKSSCPGKSPSTFHFYIFNHHESRLNHWAMVTVDLRRFGPDYDVKTRTCHVTSVFTNRRSHMINGSKDDPRFVYFQIKSQVQYCADDKNPQDAYRVDVYKRTYHPGR